MVTTVSVCFKWYLKLEEILLNIVSRRNNNKVELKFFNIRKKLREVEIFQNRKAVSKRCS